MKTANESFGTALVPQGKRAAIDLATVNSDTPLISKKRNRELNRLRKKLEQEGDVTFDHVEDPFEVILKFEEFLLMETKGWKGRAASSIHVIKKHAAFARQSVNDLARQGLCEIFTMRFNNKPIASIILFESGGHYFPWKISYDHLFSKYSPGSQLMNKLTVEITARDGFKSADSLAILGQSWMSHLWPDEVSISSIILAEDTATAAHLCHRITQKDNLKSSIKKYLFRK